MIQPSRVLSYHKVDARFEWGITRVTPGQFERGIQKLLDSGYHPTTLRMLFDNRDEEELVAITFDDAYESVYLNAFPILEKYGIRSTIFTITDYIGRENTWDVNYGGRTFRHMNAEQLREMASAGHEIASHTCTHHPLTGRSRGEIWEELHRSKQMMESLVSREVQFIAYPFARYNQDVLDLTGAAGYAAGCIFMEEPPGVVVNGTPLIHRQGVYLHDTPRDVVAKVTPGIGHRWQHLKQNLITRAAGGSVMIKQWRDGSRRAG